MLFLFKKNILFVIFLLVVSINGFLFGYSKVQLDENLKPNFHYLPSLLKIKKDIFKISSNIEIAILLSEQQFEFSDCDCREEYLLELNSIIDNCLLQTGRLIEFLQIKKLSMYEEQKRKIGSFEKGVQKLKKRVTILLKTPFETNEKQKLQRVL